MRGRQVVAVASARRREDWIAAPNRKRDDFGAAKRELAGDLWKKSIVANHHAKLAEARVEDGIFIAGRHATFDLRARQRCFAVFAGDLAVWRDENRHVVNEMVRALH